MTENLASVGIGLSCWRAAGYYLRIKNMRITLVCLLILVMQPVFAFAGTSRFAGPKDEDGELWRARSQGITDDLLKDAAQLSPARRAVILGRLARGWWAEDQTRARKWFQTAIDLVEQVPSKETTGERQERIVAARKLLKAIVRLDRNLTMSLLKVLTPHAQTSDAERTETADWIMYSATDMVAVDTNRANELARVALRIGPPNDFASFLVAMRGKDPQLADAMFTHALSLARQQPFPVQLLNTLSYAAFPTQRNYGRNIPIPSDSLRSDFLQAEIQFLNANPINDDNRGSICSCVSGFIAPLSSEFDRLLPTEAAVVQQAINNCNPVVPLVQQQLDEKSLNTAEDLLNAAADAKNGRVRTNRKFRAANLAVAANDYDLACKILDGMGKEERAFMGNVWESYRWDWAAQGAIDHYQRGRLAEVIVLLNTVPSNLQPIAKIAFLGRLPEQKDSDTAPLIQILNEALIELHRSTIPDLDKYNWYIALISPTVRYQPAEASDVLKAAVSSLNKAKDRKTLETAEFSEKIAEPLLEMDEFVVRDSLASITLVETRAQLRLVLLDATLRHMRSSQN